MASSTTSYKLYGIPYLGSMAIELLMEEAGIKYDIIFPTQEERNSAEFKMISPRGLVPVLITPCLLYTSPSPRDSNLSRMPSSA